MGKPAMKPISNLSGIAIAAAAASLLSAGHASQDGTAPSAAESSTVNVKCYGTNVPKSRAECKTETEGVTQSEPRPPNPIAD